jgi:hypothetical protein
MFVKDMADLFPAYDGEYARECVEGDLGSIWAAEAARQHQRVPVHCAE